MAKQSKRYKTPSAETQTEAMKIAKANQRPGQTKEQTKLVAQGIQKGIEQYKKQQKSKSRDLDKKLKSASNYNQTSKTPLGIISYFLGLLFKLSLPLTSVTRFLSFIEIPQVLNTVSLKKRKSTYLP